MTKPPGRIKLSALMPGPEANPTAAEPAPIEAAEATSAVTVEPAIVAAQERTPSKQEQAAGVVPFVIQLKPEDKRRLAIIAAETGLKFQHIGIAALSMWLNARGLPGLDPKTKASVPDGRKKR